MGFVFIPHVGESLCNWFACPTNIPKGKMKPSRENRIPFRDCCPQWDKNKKFSDVLGGKITGRGEEKCRGVWWVVESWSPRIIPPSNPPSPQSPLVKEKVRGEEKRGVEGNGRKKERRRTEVRREEGRKTGGQEDEIALYEFPPETGEDTKFCAHSFTRSSKSNKHY